MNKTFKITVDTQKSVQNPYFHVNTNDLRTIHLLMSVQSNGKPVNLEDAQVRIAILKPDKKTVFQDVVVVDAASGLCEVILDSQAYVVPGEHTAELMIYFVGERVSVTGRFNYRAISGILNDETVESQNEYQAINKLVLDAETAAQNAKQSENNAKQAETNAVNAAANALDELEERTEQFYEQKAAELRAPIDDLSAQLAQNESMVNSLELRKADIEYVDNVASKLGSASPKGVFTTLTELESAYPNGSEGIYLVSENGHWYFWNNIKWEDGGQYQSSIESDFPATNLAPNVYFEDNRRTWFVSGGDGVVENGILELISDGTYKYLRVTQQSTGYTPKKGDKIYASMLVEFKSEGFLNAKISVRDWVTGGKFNSFSEIDVTKVNVPQVASVYADVTSDFVDELRFYVEAEIPSGSSGLSYKVSKPLILNLTQIFGHGNEPSERGVKELLKKFGGWFEGTVTEFVSKKEAKVLSVKTKETAEIADYKASSLLGEKKLVFRNMILNGNFANADFIGGNHWVRNGVSETNAVDYVTTFTPTAKDQTLFQTIQAKKNHIYYAWAQVKATSPLVSLRFSGNANASRAHSGSGEFEFLSAIHIRDNDAGVNVEIRDKRERDWDEVVVKYVGAIDLTETFGKGYEPTKEQMDVFIKRLPNMWFDGTKDDLLTLDEIVEYYRKVEKNQKKVLEVKTREPMKYVETKVPNLIMTITYDDECSSIYDLAKPIHESENVPATFYVIPSRIGTREVFNYGVAEEWERLREMNNDGLITIQHHTYAHKTVDNTPRDYQIWQIERSQEMFWRNGIYPKHLAYPGGYHDFEAINVLQDYVESATTTSPVVNGYDLNPYRIHRLGLDNRTVEEIKAFIDDAVEQGGWLVTYQHGLSHTGISLGGMNVKTPAEQLEVIQYAKSKGAVFVSLERGLEMYAPQIYIMKPNDLETPAFAVQRNGVVVTN